MQHLVYLKAEHFNKTILGINLAKLTQYQATNVVMDKSAHAREEYMEIRAARKASSRDDITSFYPILDGAVDLDYVLNGLLFVDRRAQVKAHESPSYKEYRACIQSIKEAMPSVPYMYAYNLVHRANMKKIQGRVTKRPFKYGFDAIKPPGWEPPDWDTFFRRHVIPRKPRIAILGYSGAGKDTMAEILRDWYGYTYTQATRYILENFLWERYGLKDKYDTQDEAYKDRVNHREEWYNMICDINSLDPATIAKSIFAESNIYCGIRSFRELDSAFDSIDKIYWINCGKRIPIETGSMDFRGADLIKDEVIKKKIVIIQNTESLMKFKINIYKQFAKYE